MKNLIELAMIFMACCALAVVVWGIIGLCIDVWHDTQEDNKQIRKIQDLLDRL